MQTKHANLDCPTSDDLNRYLAGESASSGFESLDGHISMCAQCQQKLVRLGEAQNPISHLIADVVKSPPIQLTVSLQQSLERIRSRPMSENRTGQKSMDFENIALIRDYRILESIGEGGMGCVFRAIHTRLNRPVAIKVLRQDRVNSREAVSRFSREMQLIAQLEHPNIVKALDAGEQDGLHYLVMEFLAGCDVGQLSKRLGPLPIADACQIIRLAATALQYAHDQKIIHRDIKPSNLLLTPDGCVKLLDLGLAQFFDFSLEPSLSHADQAVGTLAYMAPEQLSRREEVTTRSDIFSLGVSLHELLTGQRPFERPGQSPLLAELSSIRPDVDESLSRLIGEMVSNASSKRPLSMQEIVNRLTPFVETADLSSLMTEYFRWSSRKSATSVSKLAHAQLEHRTAVVERSAHETLGDRSLARQQENGGTEMHKNSKVSRFAWPYAIAATVFLGGLGIWWGVDRITKGEPPPVIAGSVPPVIAKGELEVTALGDVAMQLLAEGSVIATRRDTPEQAPLSLHEGLNEVEPGTYTITFDGPETFEPLDDIRVVKGANRKLQLTTSLTKSFQFPPLPEETGAYAAYQGSLWLKDWPNGKKVGFNIRLQVLSIEKRHGGTNFTTLKFETISHHPSGDFEETGYLKVDTEKWRTQNRFEVTEGFVRASGPEISAWVQDNRPGSKSQSIVVPFDKEHDRLKEIAEAAMPLQRLSLHDYIALFFGDASMPVANESVRGLRSMLPMLGDRNSWLKPIANGSGFVPCFVVSSRKRDDALDTLGYLMARRKAEPFGFVRLEANTPSIVALCAVTGSGPAKVDSTEYQSVANEFLDEKPRSQRKKIWDRAGFPEPEQPASTTWQGSISVANSPRQLVKATASSLATETIDDLVCRWIEVEVSSTDDKGEDEHWEAARLLVDDEKYRETGQFEAKKGWFAFGNRHTVFALPGDSDLSEIIDQRLMLSDTPQFRRFSVIDALSMLFVAEFSPASMMSNLRKIAGAKEGLAATSTPTEIKIGSAPAMRGELWESPKNVPVNYRIIRTPRVAFDFFSVVLEQPPIAKISLQVENAGSQFGAINPTLGTPRLIDERRVATESRVKESIKPNWRVWSWKHSSGISFKAWAEFGGMLGVSTNNDRSKVEVLLRNRNGDEIRIPGNALYDDDWNWARKGRIWASVTIPKFRETQMPLIVDRGKELDIANPNNTSKVLFEDLLPEDQAHIKGLRNAQRTKTSPSEQLPKWLEFAPYIRK